MGAVRSAKIKALLLQRSEERMKVAKADDYHLGEGGSQSNRDHPCRPCGHGLGKRGRTGCAEAEDDGDGSREASEDSSSALSPVPDPAPNAIASCVGVKRRRVGRGRCGSQLPVYRGERGRRPGGRGRPARSERRRTEAACVGGTPARTESSGQDNESDTSEESEELDVPLDRLRAAAFFVTTPAVGATVDIRWDATRWPDRGGWCSGVVTAISDGNLKLQAPQPPGKKSRTPGKIVRAGFSTVVYDSNTQETFVHKLDEEHHVSQWGNRTGAWRLLENASLGSGAAVPSGTTQDPAASGVPGGQGDLDPADDSDTPLIQSRRTAPEQSCSSGPDRGYRSAAAPAARAADADYNAVVDAAPESQILASSGPGHAAETAPRRCNPDRAVTGAIRQPPRNVWSFDYCFDVFGRLPPEQFRLGTATYRLGEYSVTRQMPTTGAEFPRGANIKISVKTEESKLYYMAFTKETGLILFAVTTIRKPIGGDWSRTLAGYQVFTTEEALCRVDTEKDTEHKGRAVSLGADSLRYRIAIDRPRKWTTYHACDWQVHIDVRCIVGVVRQALATERDQPDRTRHSASGCHANAPSLIYTDQPFSETRQ